MNRTFLAVGVCVMFGLAAMPLSAANTSGSLSGGGTLATSPPQSFGTQTTVEVIGATSVMPPNSSITYDTTPSQPGMALYQTSAGQVDWWKVVPVPSGALVTGVEIEACDDTSAGHLWFGLAKWESTGNNYNIALANTGTAEIPGCTTFYTPTTATTFSNGTDELYLFFSWSGVSGSQLRIGTVRVYYNRQVSPAPLSATFGDVPTGHPFFRFVEALAASGITSGCGGGNFCPNSTVTRGQMAVFLSAALGLHWAP